MIHREHEDLADVLNTLGIAIFYLFDVRETTTTLEPAMKTVADMGDILHKSNSWLDSRDSFFQVQPHQMTSVGNVLWRKGELPSE